MFSSIAIVVTSPRLVALLATRSLRVCVARRGCRVFAGGGAFVPVASVPVDVGGV